jgi:hypothetical protein
VTQITWQAADGGTRVTIRLDGPLTEARYRQSRLEYDEVKELIVLQGITEPYLESQIAVGTAEVRRIRTGYHRKPSGDELHVVLDLSTPQAKLTRIELRGDVLELQLDR